MIDNKRLTIYAYLTEIGACEAKLKVFDDNPVVYRDELMFALEAALDTLVAGLIQNMMAFLDCPAAKYFTEVALLVAAKEYARLPWVDNTFRERIEALEYGSVIIVGGDDLPF